MKKRKHGQTRVYRQVLAYLMVVAMIVGMMPATVVKAEAAAYDTGLYLAEWDGTKTLTRLNNWMECSIPDDAGIALIYSGQEGAAAVAMEQDVSVTYCSEVLNDSSALEQAQFQALDDGQMETVSLSEEEYNGWAAKSISGGTIVEAETIPVTYYHFNRTGTYCFTITRNETPYSCYLRVTHRAWDFYAEDEISDNPLREYYYQDISENPGFYLKQADPSDTSISLGKLTRDETGNVITDEGAPVLDAKGPVAAVRVQQDGDVDYSDCIRYDEETGRISIIADPASNEQDYSVRVYFYRTNVFQNNEETVTEYWQDQTEVHIIHGQDMRNAIWVSFDAWNGAAEWKPGDVEDAARTALDANNNAIGENGKSYDIYLTEKPDYPQDFDWDSASDEERQRYGHRQGAQPVVIVSAEDGTHKEYRVGAGDAAGNIDNCGDADDTTWHFTYTYQAGDCMDIYWCDYDAFGYDDIRQFQIETESQNADSGAAISFSPVPGEADSFKDEVYGEKYNFAVSQLEAGVSVTITPKSGNTLEEVRIGDTRYVNAALQTGAENSDPTFTPDENGAWTHTFTGDEVKAYHWENNGADKVYETDEDGNPRYASIRVEVRCQGQNQGGGGQVSEDFAVKIGEHVVYQAVVEEGAPKINIPEGAPYEVEEIEGGIAIKPTRGTDISQNPEGDIAEKTGITLDPIHVTGSGRVEVHAGLNYTPEGVTDGSHIEEDVPITIRSSETGYSFEAESDAELVVCWGNFRSTATLLGGVKARGFTVNDLKALTIGSEEAPAAQAFCAPLRQDGKIYGNSFLEFNLAETNIYAVQAFVNYDEIRAWDEADVTVSVSGNDASVFENVNAMQVQTGGKFTLKSDSPIQYPDGFAVESGYYTQIGEILSIPNDGRFQDKVNMVSCEEGDHSQGAGRYRYSVSEDEKNIVLESTTNALWSLGYSFLPESGDQYVEHGHFEIRAGSGLRREGMTDGGEYWFEEGTEVTFKLVPDTGYQYKEGTFQFNGDSSERVVKPTKKPGEYIFTMPSNPIHVSCTFEKVDDTISVAQEAGVSGAAISIPDGVINGTAEFAVKEATLTAAQNTAFATAAKGKTVGNAMDLSLNEVINQIGTDDKWVTPVTDLTEPMSVTLALDASLAGQDAYEVIREHNGKTEPLQATYDEKTKSVTFKTDGYSTYAIAYKPKAVSGQHVHTLTKVEAKEATTTTPGNKAYWTCSCGKVFSDAEGKTETTASEMTIPAIGIPQKGEPIQDESQGASYVVTGTDEKNSTVAFVNAGNSKKTTIKVQPTVEKDGITYRVTAIADNAFKNNKKVTKIVLPKSVTSIGKNAFIGCAKLKTVTIGSQVTTIGANAFKGCKSLNKITLPEKTTKIGTNAFSGCTKLKMIIIKSKKLTAKSISKNAFKGIPANATIKVPKGKVNAYKLLFYAKGLNKKVTIK